MEERTVRVYTTDQGTIVTDTENKILLDGIKYADDGYLTKGKGNNLEGITKKVSKGKRINICRNIMRGSDPENDRQAWVPVLQQPAKVLYVRELDYHSFALAAVLFEKEKEIYQLNVDVIQENLTEEEKKLTLDYKKALGRARLAAAKQKRELGPKPSIDDHLE